MKRHMTKEEAESFRQRWEAANAAERDQLRATSIEDKLRQLSVLMASVPGMGWTEALEAEEAEVRERWSQLRKACGV